MGLWVRCPQSTDANPHLVRVMDWGKQTCRYEKCNGHEFDVEYNLDTATALLQEIEKQHKPTPIIESKSSLGKLQRVLDGWIYVMQP